VYPQKEPNQKGPHQPNFNPPIWYILQKRKNSYISRDTLRLALVLSFSFPICLSGLVLSVIEPTQLPNYCKVINSISIDLPFYGLNPFFISFFRGFPFYLTFGLFLFLSLL